MLAAGSGVYAILVQVISFALIVPDRWFQDLGALTFATVVSSLYAGVIAFMVVAIACSALLPILIQLARLGAWRARWVVCGCLAGAAIAQLGAFLLLALPGQLHLSLRFRFLIVGPFLFSSMLQYWGASAGVVNELDDLVRGREHARHVSGVQFTVRHLLVLTLVSSVSLALLKGLGLLSTTLMAYVGATLLWQAISFVPAIRLARWRRRRQIEAVNALVEQAAQQRAHQAAGA